MPHCSSFVHTESGAAISIVSQRKAKLCDDAETFHMRRQRCYLLAYVRRKQYREPIKNYNTCANTYTPTVQLTLGMLLLSHYNTLFCLFMRQEKHSLFSD